MPRASGRPRRADLRAAAALVLGLLPAIASAFDSKGHTVLEALAYRSLIEGHDGFPPRPEVLRDLLNDGALEAPICFGYGASPPAFCADVASGKNPLLDWPRPRTDQPDAAFRRQFSDPGQCFHFMAMLDDAQTEVLPGTSIPRALATSALVRCRDLLDDLLRQIVIEGGAGTRGSAYGLYELMHAVGDSFSGAHSERRAGDGKIESLRVWKPLLKLARLSTERSARIPASVFHKWNDHRDHEYVIEDRRVSGGRRCKELTDLPYEVPYECLSETGDQARQALVDLLVTVRDLRMERLAGAAADPFPERSESWRAYKEKWFAPAYDCRDAECGTKQPADTVPGAYGLIGLDTTYNSSRNFFDVAARGTLLRYGFELNPFIYAVSGEFGYRSFNSGGGSGLAALELDLVLPLGKRAALGFAPAAWRVAFGGEHSGSEIVTRLLRFDWRLADRLCLTLNAPLEMNWRRPAVEWSFGLGLSYAPGGSQAAGGPVLQSHGEKAERSDESWEPPPAPYGRLLGRRPSWYVATSGTTVETPALANADRLYGLGSIGTSLMWDRDRWGGRFVWTPAVSLAIGARRTSGDSAYLTGVLAAGLRWYCLGPLGLSLTPVRIEGGPKVRGQEEDDPSPDVHGSPGSQYYFQAGTRAGIVFNAGVVDILVEAPTLAWRSHPFSAGEIVTFGLGIRLN